METIKLSGIDKSLILGSSLGLSLDENGLYCARVFYKDNGKSWGRISSMEKTLSECICGIEAVLSNKNTSNKAQAFVSNLEGIKYLLDNNFEISINLIDKEMLGIMVTSEDQASYLVNGLFSARTLASNGVVEVLGQCNGWASTLQRHFNPEKQMDKDSENYISIT